MPTLKSLLPEIEKTAKVEGMFGGALQPVARIPTGIFPLDLAIGGGIPAGRVTEIYGAEGSGKTNLVLKTIAQNQQLNPKQTNVFIDMEGTWDPMWAQLLGVDTDKVYVIRPDYAEQVADMMRSFLDADDVGIIALDSLAAMGTTKEIEGENEKAVVSESARIIKRMVQQVTMRLNHRRNEGKPNATLIWINQTRSKVGVMYGDPETTPGGQSPRFLYSLRLKIYGKPLSDKAISPVLPYAREVTCTVKKYKVPITAMNCGYVFVTLPHKDLVIGEVDDWHTIETFLKASKALEKTKSGYRMFDAEYPTLKACRAFYRSDFQFRHNVQQAIVAAKVSSTGFVQGDGEGEDMLVDAETGEVVG